MNRNQQRRAKAKQEKEELKAENHALRSERDLLLEENLSIKAAREANIQREKAEGTKFSIREINEYASEHGKSVQCMAKEMCCELMLGKSYTPEEALIVKNLAGKGAAQKPGTHVNVNSPGNFIGNVINHHENHKESHGE